MSTTNVFLHDKAKKNLKFKKEANFGGFQLSEMRKKSWNDQNRILGFHCVIKHIEGSLKICTLCLIYSQIWLNFPKDDCHFFLWMVTTLATNKSS